jgi:uncharacterized RDD family membrane protein YckC
MTSSLTTPGLTRRLCCLLYELLLMLAVLLLASALYTPLKAWLGASFWLEQLFRLFLAAVLFGYFGLSWVRRGQTVAMKTWRIKLVGRDGGTVGWPQALGRYLVTLALFVGLPLLSYLGWERALGHTPEARWLPLLWWLIPYLAAFHDKERQFLHDQLAGTRQILLPPRQKA